MVVAGVAAAAVVTGFAGTASAAWEPKQPIQILVGFSPGGGTDIIARNIASAAQPFFPVPLVVVNKPGAAGSIAAETVKNSKPDGYTLFVAGGSESVSMGNHQKLGYDIRKDFTGVMQITRQRVAITVNDSSPWKTVGDMVEAVKAAPGKYTFGSSGAGSTYHSIMLVLAHEAGLDMKHTPYQGGAPSLAALLGGHIDVTPLAPEESASVYEAGRIRYLALASDGRSPALPDVPTVQEEGYDVFVENLKGFAGPAGMPDEVVAYLHDNFKKALESEAFKKLADKANLELQYRNGEDFMGAITDMYNQIGTAVK